MWLCALRDGDLRRLEHVRSGGLDVCDPRRPALFELRHIEALVERQPRLSKAPDQVPDIELSDSHERYRADRAVLRHSNEPLQRLHGFGWTGIYAKVEHLQIKARR